MLHEQILVAALKIREEFNQTYPDMAIDRIDLAGCLGEAIGLLCTLNDAGLEEIMDAHEEETHL